MKNEMKTKFFSKKVGFIAQNFDFYPLKTFLAYYLNLLHIGEKQAKVEVA